MDNIFELDFYFLVIVLLLTNWYMGICSLQINHLSPDHPVFKLYNPEFKLYILQQYSQKS